MRGCLAVFVLASVACSDDKKTPDTAGGSAAGDDFATAYCAAARACCAKDALDATGLASCEADAVEQLSVLQALARGSVTQAQPAFDRCLSELAALGQQCEVEGTTFAACRVAFVGSVATGDPCHKVVECDHSAGPVVCLKHRPDSASPSPELGVCRELERAELGAGCLLSADESFSGVTYTTPEAEPPLAYCAVEDELYCDFASQVCTSRAAASAACTSSEQCRAGLGCIQSTCRALKQAGEACSSSAECSNDTGCRNGQCGPVPFASESLCGGDLD